ncbi:MAG: C40 family peptidase [Bacteroidia bacterium]|nr:C40 family peptidase [Bacteroidia bacterium]
MRHIIYIVLCVGVLAFSSCSSSKKSAGKTKTVSVSQLKGAKSTSSGSKSTSSAKNTDSNKPTIGKMDAATASKKLGVKVTSSDNQKLYFTAASWIGTPYKYGGLTRGGVDCSGFTYTIYKEVFGKTLARQSKDMLTTNCKKTDKKNLKEGDLVFFRTDGKRSSEPNHVGVYLKEGKFIHASSSKGVVVSDLATDYYIKTYISGGKVVK